MHAPQHLAMRLGIRALTIDGMAEFDGGDQFVAEARIAAFDQQSDRSVAQRRHQTIHDLPGQDDQGAPRHDNQHGDTRPAGHFARTGQDRQVIDHPAEPVDAQQPQHDPQRAARDHVAAQQAPHLTQTAGDRRRELQRVVIAIHER